MNYLTVNAVSGTATLAAGAILYEHDDGRTWTLVGDGLVRNIMQISDPQTRRVLHTVSTEANPPQGLKATWSDQ